MELQIFENSEFGSVRTLLDEDGKILFCGLDVAQALGYSRTADAIRTHTKGSVKRRVLTNGGSQRLAFIPEPDVYRLIFRSKLPTAEKFEAWVVEIVLPTYLLEEMGFAYRANNQLWPYAFMVHYGYATLKDYVVGKHGGTYMLFTPLGKLYLQKRIAQRLAAKNLKAPTEDN